MTTDRRTFLKLSALAGGAVGLGGFSPSEALGFPLYRGLPDVEQAPRSKRILILGGTGFTGPFQVAYAVARGHQVTVFNRGRNNEVLPDGVEELYGDRNAGEVQALAGREWDVVIDNPTTLPHWVHDVGQLLHDRTGQYLFISTISVYDLGGVTRVNEETPALGYTGGDPLDVRADSYTGALYGPMKAAAEAEGHRWFGDRTTVIRPGLIVGPRDGTDRFTYWPLRIDRGGDIIAPGDGLDPVQIIDGRDLAQWTVRMVENGTTGVFNATGPRSTMTMSEQLYGIRGALSGDLDLRFHWLPAEFLQAHQVRQWGEMTTWFGPRAPISSTNIERAVAAGLTFRSLAETTTDTLAWFRAEPAERQGQLRAGLAPEKERQVLAAWRAEVGA